MTYNEFVAPFFIGDQVKTTYAINPALRGQILKVIAIPYRSTYVLSDNCIYAGTELTIYRHASGSPPPPPAPNHPNTSSIIPAF